MRDDDSFGESSGGRGRPKTEETKIKTFENPYNVTFFYIGSTCKSNPDLTFKARYHFDTNELNIKLPDSVQIMSQEIKCGPIKLKQVQDGRLVTVFLDINRDVWEDQFVLELKHRNGSHTDITKYQFEVLSRLSPESTVL